jgi:hypothetical protein
MRLSSWRVFQHCHLRQCRSGLGAEFWVAILSGITAAAQQFSQP